MNDVRPETMERITNKKLAKAFIDEQVAALKKQIGDGKCLLALSGGVDSSVCAALLIKAIGKNLVCVHVNHGLLRKGEPEQVIRVFRDQLNANLVGKMVSEGTTPRRLTDLIGSLCDLTSGSGDKGTPVVLVQGYFDNYTN